MEKKTKLTISGNVKKKIERFNYSGAKKSTSIILDRPTNRDKGKVNTRPGRRPPNTGFKKNNLNQNKKNFVFFSIQYIFFNYHRLFLLHSLSTHLLLFLIMQNPLDNPLI